MSLSFSADSNLVAVGAYICGNDGPGYVNIYGVDEPTLSFTQFGDSLVGDKDGDRFGWSLVFFQIQVSCQLERTNPVTMVKDILMSTDFIFKCHSSYNLTIH